MKFTSENKNGFTLLEVIVVIFILGIVSAVGMNSLNSNLLTQVAAETDVIKTHIRFAQTKAIGSNSVYGFTYNGTSYNVYKYNSATNAADPIMIPGVSENIINTSNSVNLSNKGITLNPSPFTLSFDSWGTPYTNLAGTVRLITNLTITVTINNVTRNFTVTRNTGFIN